MIKTYKIIKVKTKKIFKQELSILVKNYSMTFKKM